MPLHSINIVVVSMTGFENDNFTFSCTLNHIFLMNGMFLCFQRQSPCHGEGDCVRVQPLGGGPKRLPKFKFSAKFPIGLHVILQIQIKKSKMTAILIM